MDFMQKHKIGRFVYGKLRSFFRPSLFKIEDLQTIISHHSEGDECCYNLVVPTLRKSNVFGGILTAIKIFSLLLKHCGYRGRVVVLGCNEKYTSKRTYQIENFYNDKSAYNQLLYMSDTNDEIAVKKNDIFIFTSWITAYSFMPVINWQIRHYNLIHRKAIYLIQDYEPGFRAWSSEYILAESTYKTDADKIIALYNSKELYEYFQVRKYGFFRELYFSPVLNEKLRAHLIDKMGVDRKKQILIYGRPNSYRNAFEIIKGALALWSQNYKDAKDWKIISLGAFFENIKLSNNIIEVRGKVSLEEYGNIMLSSYIGISLMISPHPSYPPLEMSTFGVRTITNTFENKDLSYFNKNIISINNCSPVEIAFQLEKICNEYDKVHTDIVYDGAYVDNKEFDMVIEKLGDHIREMICQG